jgi:Helix-turn-helix domain
MAVRTCASPIVSIAAQRGVAKQMGSQRMATAELAPAYLTIAEVAHLIGVHPATITRWVLKGFVDPTTGHRVMPEGIRRTPGRWLIPPGSIELFLERLAAARQAKPAQNTPGVDAARERELASVDARLQAIGL